MANALYDNAREAFLSRELDWGSDVIKTILVDTDLYTVDLVNDQFLDDIPAGARVSTSPALTTKTVAAGVADADDTTHPSVTGATVEAIVIYEEEATDGASRLIGYLDGAIGLPLTPNGADVTIQWNDGADKIFKL